MSPHCEGRTPVGRSVNERVIDGPPPSHRTKQTSASSRPSNGEGRKSSRKVICVVGGSWARGRMRSPGPGGHAQHTTRRSGSRTSRRRDLRRSRGPPSTPGAFKGALGSGAITGQLSYAVPDFQGTFRVYLNKGTLKGTMEGSAAPAPGGRHRRFRQWRDHEGQWEVQGRCRRVHVHRNSGRRPARRDPRDHGLGQVLGLSRGRSDARLVLGRAGRALAGRG